MAALLLAGPLAPLMAQSARWNDRATNTWTEEAPGISVYIESGRTPSYGGPVRVRFEVTDDAYVVIARVTSDGELTILYPTSRTQRTFVKGGSSRMVYGRRAGNLASFFATDRGGTGYVFGLASARPVDLSRFSNRDFERLGTSSQFSLANRRYSFRPDEYIERFAAAVLWDPDTPYDYDVDYYATNASFFASSAAMCNGWGRASSLLLDFGDRFYSHPYASYYGWCSGYYSQLSCLGLSVFHQYSGCSPWRRSSSSTYSEYPTTRNTEESTTKVNIGMVRGGLWEPDKVKRQGDDDPLREDKLVSGRRFERPRPEKPTPEWERFYSIPERAIRTLKASEADQRRKDAVGQKAERDWEDTESRGRRFERGDDAARAPDRTNAAGPERKGRTGESSGSGRFDRAGDTRRNDPPPMRNDPPQRSGPSRDRTSDAPPRPASNPPSIRTGGSATDRPAAPASPPPATRPPPPPTPPRSDGGGSSGERKPPR
jgi:hypothetical protein